MPPFTAVMAHGTMPRPAPKLANGQTQLSLAITRWTRVRGPKSVPEFTAKAFADHHWRIGAVSICRPKSLNSLGCSGGKASQTTNFMGNDKAKAHATGGRPQRQQCQGKPMAIPSVFFRVLPWSKKPRTTPFETLRASVSSRDGNCHNEHCLWCRSSW